MSIILLEPAYKIFHTSVKFKRRTISVTPFERSRWRGGRYACDTPDIMGCRSILNRLSPVLANAISFSMLQAKVDSIPIA
jgi:hypothetical protein